ncbi:universal stress protein [Nocardia sp. NPDC050712]|uniref:universal stress protein n=1 Tax=Nocardia sp. NPDC050712 TaxID=3155518 RepID=UPI0033D375A7
MEERQTHKTRTGYRSIVVGIDNTPRSNSAVVAAARLAQDPSASLTIAGTYRRLPSSEWSHTSDLLGEDAYHVTPVSAMDELLAAAASRAHAAGAARVVRCSMPGKPVDALLAVAKSARADLIVVGERVFDTGWGRIFGSFAAEMARRCPVDVLIVRLPHTETPDDGGNDRNWG